VFESKDRTCNGCPNLFPNQMLRLKLWLKYPLESDTTIFFRPFRFPKVCFLLILNTKSCKLPFLPGQRTLSTCKTVTNFSSWTCCPLKGSTVVGKYAFLLLMKSQNQILFSKSAFVTFWLQIVVRVAFYKCHVIFICWNYIVRVFSSFSWSVWIKKILFHTINHKFPIENLVWQCSELACEKPKSRVC
jgi:hypothetical protein